MFFALWLSPSGQKAAMEKRLPDSNIELLLPAEAWLATGPDPFSK